MEIDDLDQVSDVLDGWGIAKKPSQLDVQRALDFNAVWIGRGCGSAAEEGTKGSVETG
jgi:hypothetical protein